jgi:hypothetical protein
MGLEQFYPGEWPVHDERVKEVAGGAVTSIAGDLNYAHRHPMCRDLVSWRQPLPRPEWSQRLHRAQESQTQPSAAQPSRAPASPAQLGSAAYRGTR